MTVRSLADRGLRVGVKSVAACLDRFRPPAPGVVVLIYHRVGGRSGSEVDLPPELFEAQVAELSEAGRLVSLDAALQLLAAAPPASPAPASSPVVLSFDDGTADWVTEVLPVLERHQAPATFYVGTDFVERGLAWPGGAEPVTWAGLAELVASGWPPSGRTRTPTRCSTGSTLMPPPPSWPRR